MPDRTYPPLPDALVVPVYDDHTHIDPSVRRDEPGIDHLDWREHLDRASAVGVRGIVQVGVDVETSRWGAEHAASEPRMLAAVALHPNEAPLLEAAGGLDEAIAEIDALAALPRVRAVGETGLDYFRTDESGRAAQLKSFEAHIDIAKRHGLALQIHDRDAHDDVVATLLRVGAPEKTVFHCFSGEAALARLAAEHGWYLSFAGTVTFKNAPALREALAVVPRSLIMVETDAPYLTPAPHRGRPNAPYLIPHTLRFMAQHLGTEVEHLAAQTASNTVEVYGSWETELTGAVPPAEPDGAIA
ncbi:TatD family hydrolase [Gryllotalpicola ginsengisoli]|uniref:TatD family hydrolase n=1 Tax=Gryllotalpicola ginsengisoli TaxID=444608 RepID=UPI0003B4C6F4|nr:TatD family hydrolase [Gryllotalpicola ginsengisoli]